MRIENAGRTLDDQAVQIGRPDCLGKGLAEAVQEIEDQRLFDLDFLLRALELADPRRSCNQRDEPPARDATSSPRRRDGHMRQTARLLRASRDGGLVLDNRERL